MPYYDDGPYAYFHDETRVNGDRGWTVETTELFSETVTTTDEGSGTYRADLAYSGVINADTITVTYDGTEYTCPRIDAGGAYVYGGFNNGPDFTEYPFFIVFSTNINFLITQTAGEHTIAVSTTTLQTSPDFNMARGYGYKDTMLFNETVTAESAGTLVQLAYSGAINVDTITVTFDGTEYKCQNRASNDIGSYGAMILLPSGYDFSAFPFFIGSNNGVNSIAVKTAGEHTVSVTLSTMQIYPDFSSAVNAALPNSTVVPLLCVSGETTLPTMERALNSSHQLLYFIYDYSVCCMVTSIFSDSSGWHVTYIPDDGTFTAGFDENDIFTLTPAS